VRNGEFTVNRTARFLSTPAGILLAVFIAVRMSGANEPPPHERGRFWIRQDSDVAHVEPAPHDGTGSTTAYRYFDDVENPGVVFRKRALPKGGSIGMHVLGHDEVYYVLSGQAELTVDAAKRTLQPGTAAYMREGADVGIRQLGAADLVIIVAYPPAKTVPAN
jgi:quercetin dioxygenase-like cupin family protein